MRIEQPVVLLIRSLDVGGAERQLVQLAIGLHRRGVRVLVVTFYDGGDLSAELERAGVATRSLGKRGRWDLLGFLIRFVMVLRRARPAVAYGFLATGNTLLALMRSLLPGALIVWGLRASKVDLAKYDAAARVSYWLERMLCHVPDLVIANSEAGRRHALAVGFPFQKVVVVPNGIDTQRFRLDESGRRRVRAEWGVGEAEPLIGLVARLDPMKDHSTFLRAVRLIAAEVPTARFVCVGDGPAPLRKSLEDSAIELGVADRVLWSGQRQDMSAVFSALDVACSASAFGEGFSNAVGEALSCAVPCVGTDVGDTRAIIGDTGRVVPPQDPEALARGVVELLQMPQAERTELGARARARIVDNFSLDRLVDRTVAAWSVVRPDCCAPSEAGQ